MPADGILQHISPCTLAPSHFTLGVACKHLPNTCDRGFVRGFGCVDFFVRGFVMRGFFRAWILCAWIFSCVDFMCVDFFVRGFYMRGFFRACIFFAWMFLRVDFVRGFMCGFMRGFYAWTYL